MYRFEYIVVSVILCSGIANGIAPVETKTFRKALTQQGFQTILQSIEERLRNLDHVYNDRIRSSAIAASSAGCDLQEVLRRLESLETAISDTQHSDLLTRRLDALHDRLHDKLTYLESKMDIAIFKLQGKVARMEQSLTLRQSELETEFADSVLLLENVKSNLGTLQHKFTESPKTLLNNLTIHLDSIQSSVHDYGREILKFQTDTRNKCPNKDNISRSVKEAMLNEKEGNNNAFNWRIGELERKLDNGVRSVRLAQDLFLDNCHRIQMDEPRIEHKITVILDKLFQTFVNKSARTLEELETIVTILKSHDDHIFGGLEQNTNTLQKLSEKTSEDRKKLEKLLSTIKRNISEMLNKIQETIGYQYEENTNLFQELQDQINNTTIQNYSKIMAQIQDELKHFYHNLHSIQVKLNSNKTSKTDEIFLQIFPDSYNNDSNRFNISDLSRYNYTVLQEDTTTTTVKTKENNSNITPGTGENVTNYKNIDSSANNNNEMYDYLYDY